MKRVYLALPTDDGVAEAIRERLKRRKSAKHLEVVDELTSAQVVVTSTAHIESLPERLPESVELLQLTDCGGALRYRDAPGLTISNASHLFAFDVSAIVAFLTSGSGYQIRRDGTKGWLQLGVIGLGRVGREFLDLLVNDAAAEPGPPDSNPFELDKVVICDIRTPIQGHLGKLRHSFSTVGISVRRVTLDQLVSTSDIVLVAAHHGPTADPLLGARESRLLDERAWVIDASERGVVDQSAFDPVTRDMRFELLNASKWVKLVAEEEAIDQYARDFVDAERGRPTYVRVDEIPRLRSTKLGVNIRGPAQRVARYVAWNLRRFDRGKAITAVEHLDFPAAGDPAFWSSSMPPSQAENVGEFRRV